MNTLLLALKAKSFLEKKAIRYSCGKWMLSPKPLLLVTSFFSGQDSTLLGSLMGNEHRYTFDGVFDPRKHKEQFEYFMRFGSSLIEYFFDCQENGIHPQVIVPNVATVRHIETLAHRIFGLRTDQKFMDTYPEQGQMHKALKRAVGKPLALLSQRSHVAGQQLLVPMTTCLSSIWATGQSSQEDQNLAALLAWIRGEDPAAFEEGASSPRLDPRFDAHVYYPYLQEASLPGKDCHLLSNNFLAGLNHYLSPRFCLLQEGVSLLRQEQANQDNNKRHLIELVNYEKSESFYVINTIRESKDQESLRVSGVKSFEVHEALVDIVDHLFAQHDVFTRLSLRIEGKVFLGELLEQKPWKTNVLVLKVNMSPESDIPRKNDALVDRNNIIYKVVDVRSSNASNNQNIAILSIDKKNQDKITTPLNLIKHHQDLGFIKTLRLYQHALHEKHSWARKRRSFSRAEADSR